MESQTEKGTARYWKRAKLWQDDQIISAETIDLYRDEKRLAAENEVTTLFYPKTDHQQTSGPSGSGPVKVQAHKLTYEDKLQRMLYETKVSMNSSMGKVTCDRLEIFLNREEKQTSVERMLARGSVHVEQQGRTSSSSLAEFFSADNLVVLTGGQPKITDPARGFTAGARLTMHLNDDRLSVEGEPENRTITRQNVAR
jgi:lipopolysaccharide export system protein LptA